MKYFTKNNRYFVLESVDADHRPGSLLKGLHISFNVISLSICLTLGSLSFQAVMETELIINLKRQQFGIKLLSKGKEVVIFKTRIRNTYGAFFSLAHATENDFPIKN